MAYSKKERESYNKYRESTSSKLGIDKNEYNRLRRAAQSLHRSDEDSAMGTKEWRHNQNSNKEYKEKEYKKDVGHAFKKAKAKALQKAKGLHFHHQSDPRGASLYVAKEKLKDTDYSSKGHHIY
jgi:hypothetical protein